jgi:hypothetical protein
MNKNKNNIVFNHLSLHHVFHSCTFEIIFDISLYIELNKLFKSFLLLNNTRWKIDGLWVEYYY